MLLPPKPDVCQECAVDHKPAEAHNRDSLYYQYWFVVKHGRWPTWADAIEHVTDAAHELWRQALADNGITVAPRKNNNH